MLGLASAVAGFVLAGCFAAQPPPECSVQGAAVALGVTPYYVQLTKVDGTGTCGDLTFMQMGTQRSRLPPAEGTTNPSNGGFTMHYKPSLPTDMRDGLVFSADSDPTNDCSQYNGDDVLCDTCVATGDPSTDNVCMAEPDPVPRTDATDPDGAKLVGTAKLPQFPTDGICAATDFVAAEQNFQEEVIDLVDGGTQTFPALTVKTEWSNFEVLATAKAPGTVWRAKLKYTEGNCVANYDAFAFWPNISCGGATQEYADEKCNPDSNLNYQCFPESGGGGTVSTDGGCDTGFLVMDPRVLGSGINPEFKPKCDRTAGVCKPTVTWDDLKSN
jgi:hypothetical protein